MPSKKRPARKKPAAGAKASRKPARKSAAKPANANVQTVTAHLICAGAADAIDFYVRAFGAKEEIRIPGGNGKLMHAAVRIGNSTVMLAEETPDWGALSPKSLKGSPVTLHLVVPNVDAFVANAVKAGAEVTMPIADMFWGDRYGKLEDPFGHHWSVATHQRDVTPQEMQQAMKQMGS
jgi:PhnB protein